jgi:hypothetical protein
MLKVLVGAFHDTFSHDAVVARELNIFPERLQQDQEAHRAFAMSEHQRADVEETCEETSLKALPSDEGRHCRTCRRSRPSLATGGPASIDCLLTIHDSSSSCLDAPTSPCFS